MPRGRILLVDDEQCFLYPMRLLLERQGYEVEAAGSARDAVEQLIDDAFDAVVTDVHLGCGGMDGFTVVDAARSACDGVRVILTSGEMDGALMQRANQEGVDAFLLKPFSYRVLMNQLAGFGVHPSGCDAAGPKEE